MFVCIPIKLEMGLIAEPNLDRKRRINFRNKGERFVNVVQFSKFLLKVPPFTTPSPALCRYTGGHFRYTA